MDMGSLRSNFPARPHHFFKIIHSDIVPQSKLMMPRMFVKNYGEELADCVFLQTPSGAIWQVELERSNGEVWLHNGWQEFAAYYSLCFGHLLVFQYEGNSHFLVLIFDTTASEVEYPVSTTEGEGCRVQKMQENADTSLNKRMRMEHSNEPDNTVNRRTKDVSGLRLASEAEKARALASAKGFYSENPFIMVKMHPTYVSGRVVYVSRTFVERYITKEHACVILQDTDGRTWPAKCTVYQWFAMFSSGWNSFIRDNNLAVGDVCVFELINRTKNLLKVFIFRAAQDIIFCSSLNKRMKTEHSAPDNTITTNHNRLNPINLEEDLDLCGSEHRHRANGISGLRLANEHEKARALVSAKAFNSENPFMVKMLPSYVAGRPDLYVSRTFVKRYITENSASVILQDTNGRTWPVTCTLYTRSAVLNSGWKSFARDNDLAVGDVCVFELISNTEKLLKVSIFRDAKNANS